MSFVLFPQINIRDPNDLTTILDTADVGFADLVGVQVY